MISPRMEPVLEPRFDRDGLLCAVGAIGDAVFGLFVQNVENRFLEAEEPRMPMRWDFIGCVPAWDNQINSIAITAVASFDGSQVFLSADATFQDSHVEIRLFQLDISSGVFTQMPISTKIFKTTVNALIALGNKDVFGVTSAGMAMHWSGLSIIGAPEWEPLAAGSWAPMLTTITADPTTKPPTLFVGGVGEVHVSIDEGKSWQKTALGLPKTFQVSDLRWVDDGRWQRLYLSTYGRSTWVADKVEGAWG